MVYLIDMIKYTIIIPTYNRSDLLKRCLSSIFKLKTTQNDSEVFVIDNGSNDNTKEIAESFSSKIKNLRYFYDNTPGLHIGRHLGAREAQGEILCYLDDDSFVDKNWLTGIEKAFNNPDIVIAGGANIPKYETFPLRWLNYFWSECSYGKYISQLSLLDFGKTDRFIPLCFVFGCNFNIRKDILFEYGGFNPDGMPQDLLKFRGDGETGLCAKLNNAGYKAFYSHEIKIRHFVPKSRITESYFKKRAFAQGISDAFTQIRTENGIYNQDDFDFIKNFSDFTKPEKSEIEKKIFEFKKKYDPAYKKYLEIQQTYTKSFKEGKKFLYDSTREDSSHLEYVLKETYL